MSEPSEPIFYESPPPPSPAFTQLNVAAIVLIVLASIAWLYGIVNIGVILWKGIPPAPDADPARSSGYYVGAYGTIVIFALADILAPVLIFGAAQMLRRRGYGFCKATAILAMLPVSTHCMCVLTLPLGIWALVLLLRPDVKAAFVRAGG